jgi:Concanavalin A-like lectin/glucanases superfamily/PEP-CTERM motif
MKTRVLTALMIVIMVNAAFGSISDGLVAYWAFDEGVGTQSADSAGGHTAILMGDATWGTGVLDGALSLDGSGDWAQAINYKGIIGTASRTTAAWVKFTRPDYVENEGIMAWGSPSSGGRAWSMALNRETMSGTEGAIEQSISDGRITGSKDIRDNKWHHVAAVFQTDSTPNSNDIKLYVDGVEEIYSYKNSEYLDTNSSGDVVIGASWWAGNVTAFTQGLLDEVRIYDRALCPAEIVELTQVPEPATMCLLGLGGLMLRRRK